MIDVHKYQLGSSVGYVPARVSVELTTRKMEQAFTLQRSQCSIRYRCRILRLCYPHCPQNEKSKQCCACLPVQVAIEPPQRYRDRQGGEVEQHVGNGVREICCNEHVDITRTKAISYHGILRNSQVPKRLHR